MSDNNIEFLSPVGRLVQGDVFKPNKTDTLGNPLVIKHGANAGQPREEYYFAIAIPKTDPGFQELYGKILQAAKMGYPSFFDASGNLARQLNLKLIDGDDTNVNQAGKRWCDYEGFPGHWVVRMSSGFAPKVFDNTPAMNQIHEPTAIKRGDYIQVSGTIAPNGSGNTPNPGVFINHNLVRLVGYGEAISSGPDPQQVFSAPAALPAGASATPVAPAHAPAPVGTPGLPQGSAPAPVATPAMGAPVAPAVPGVSAQAGALPSSPAPLSAPAVAPATGFTQGPASAPAETKHQTPDGQIYTKSQLLGFGWSEADIANSTKQV